MAKNKRGISPIIATVLTIMITIAAVAIIAGFVVPFVKNSLQKSTECLPYKEYYLFDESFGYNCKDNANNLYAFSIKASFDKALSEKIEGIRLVLNDKRGFARSVELKKDDASLTAAGGFWVMGEKQNNLRLPGPGGIVTYVYNATNNEDIISIEVYPVIIGGKICADLKESININSCANSLA